MSTTSETLKLSKNQLLLFVGYADDAKEESKALCDLQPSLQKELENYLLINPTIPYHTIKIWEWRADASSEIGGQKATIDPVIEKADIAVFVFKDRMGGVTWEEINLFRNLKRRRWLLSFFSKKPSDLEKLSDPAYMVAWTNLLQKKQELTKDWNATESKAIKPVEDYTSTEDLKEIAYENIKKALIDILGSQDPPPPPSDPNTYLSSLLNECRSIEIRGVKVSDSNAHRLDIEKLYTPLHITGGGEMLKKEADGKKLYLQGKKVNLDEVIKNKASTIIGDPGVGKSTFLKRIVTILCRTLLKEEPSACKEKLGLDPAPPPVFVRLFDLATHIKTSRANNEKGCPIGDDNPAWLFHYLDCLSSDRRWGLTRQWFEKQCDTETGLAVLLDGLDEAPDKRSRNDIVSLVNKLKNDCPNCRIVVTSRPVAFEDSATMTGFITAEIAPLDDEGVNTFLSQWCNALYYDSTESAENHFQVLRHEVFARAAIRRMAANPVMLTALAVVHWNNKRLPEQRAELYESVIGWLLDSRDMKRPDRIPREQCREHLQMIACAMQGWQGGRQQALERGEMIDLLAPYMKGAEEKKQRSKAEKFIENEELDSGIIRARGNMVEFWHLTFLEYLAAREIAGMGDESQKKQLLKKEIIDNPNWRETLLLFIGVLWAQGRKKVEGFFIAMLDKMEDLCKSEDSQNVLAREARCFGLMGAMLRDLQPYD